MSVEGKAETQPIAIISVHGVADQLPYDSARQIAQMLLQHSDKNGHQPYESFSEKQFHFLERRFNFRLDAQPHNSSYAFLQEQLTCPENDPTPESLGPITSIRLEGDRHIPSSDLASPTPDTQPVHIYEMYWADLSRLQNEVLRVFSEFYQILFHLSRIGRRSVSQLQHDLKKADHSTWNFYRTVQIGAERCLTLGIPLANMFMLVTALTILPFSLNASYLRLVSAGTLLIALVMLLGEILWRFPDSPLAGLRKPKSIGSLAVLIYAFLCYRVPPWGIYQYMAGVTAGLLCLITLAVAKKYGRRRPHAFEWALKSAGVWGILFFLLLLFAPNSLAGVVRTCFQTIEITFIPLLLIWVGFNGSQIIAAVIGYVLPQQATDDAQKAKIKQSTWIARLSLSAPSALFLLVTLTLWYAIAAVSQNLIPETMTYTPLISHLFIGEGEVLAKDFPTQLIIAAATSSFPFVLGAVILAFGIGILALLPSIGAELFPRNYAQHREHAQHQAVKQRLDQWLNRGLGWLYIATEIITITMVVFSLWNLLLLFLEVLQLVPIHSISNFAAQNLDLVAPFNQSDSTQTVFNILFVLIASSATSLLALGSRLAKFTSGIRNLLDVVLDVDNYLRVRPQGHNPKARIFNRYTSLLRYIRNWSNPDNPNQTYGAIVIIAHSQGTVITADLLRVLTRTDATLLTNSTEPTAGKTDFNAPSRLNVVPIYLYTMGSPLKQLYSYSFPSLYDWMEPLDSVQNFGVQHWKNVYCSGDYVGRTLWTHPHEKLPEGFSEICLGAGAHTHYWDHTFPKVAQYLDEMVLECSEQLRSKLQT